jgi:predicted transcriptional regulator of viral defense system
VAQFTPDDPRLAYVDGGELASIRQGILRVAVDRFPDGIVCLTTALFIHGLTDRCGPAIWMWGAEPPIDTSGLRLFTADPTVFATGHAPYSLQDGVSARVTTPARSIVDCFSWHEFIGGPQVAEAALRKAIRERTVTASAISRLAERRDVAAPLVAAALKKIQSH